MPTGSSHNSGPAPARSSQRRRANKPASYGVAQSEMAGRGARQPALGFEAHSFVDSLWKSLKDSPESQYYSAADWDRLRMELWSAHKMFSADQLPPASSWKTLQDGLNALLISPAEKRRLGIEMMQAVADPDEDAAVAQLDDYRAALGSA